MVSTLQGVDITVVRKGNQLTSEAAKSLVRPISNIEIDKALKDIDIDKAPGSDRFNILFLLKAWEMIKDYIYDEIKEFFGTDQLLKQVNNTL